MMLQSPFASVWVVPILNGGFDRWIRVTLRRFLHLFLGESTLPVYLACIAGPGPISLMSVTLMVLGAFAAVAGIAAIKPTPSATVTATASVLTLIRTPFLDCSPPLELGAKPSAARAPWQASRRAWRPI